MGPLDMSLSRIFEQLPRRGGRRSAFEERSEFGRVQVNLAPPHLDRKWLQVRTLTGTSHAQAVVGSIAGTVRAAYQVSPGWVPEIPGSSVVKSHRQVTALVLVGPHRAVPQSKQKTFVLERSVSVGEPQTLLRNIVDASDQLHGPAPSSGSMVSNSL
jgi:hypothetical protein